MIKTHYDACRILGLSANSCKEQWKKTYHEICLKYHPDVWVNADLNERQKAEDYFILATKAYEFLEKEAEQSVIIPNSVNADFGNIHQVKKQKILGNTGSNTMANHRSYSNYESYQKRQAVERQRREEEKQRKLEELHEKSRLLKEQGQRKKEEEILNQIRWLRVAALIHETIEEDRKRKEL